MDTTNRKRKREEQDAAASPKADPEQQGDSKNVLAAADNETVTAATTSTFSSLERPDGQGMNPRNILMGIYGPRGEKIRHIVHDGALKLPASAIEILSEMQQESTRQTKKAPTEAFELPAIDGVLRPTMDTTLEVIVITELTATECEPPAQPDPDGEGVQQQQELQSPPTAEQPKWQTHARNWKLKLQQPKKQEDTAERIRGGGDDSDVIMTNAHSATDTSTQNNERSTDHTMMDTAAAGALNESEGKEQVASGQPSVAPLGTDQEQPHVAAEAFEPPKVSEVKGAGGQDDEVAAAKPTSGSSTQVAAASTQPLVGVSSEAQLTPPVPPTGVAFTEVATAPSQPSSTEASSDAQVTPSSGPVEKPPMSTSPTVGAQTESPHAAEAATTTTAAPITETEKAPTIVESAAPAAPTPPVTSSAATAPKAKVPPVIPLAAKPAPQWEQQMPGQNDEMQTEPKTPKPAWYSAESVSDLEQTMLPEWFDGSAMHRTPESYKKTRERIIEISDKLKQRFVTGTLIRRTIPGDAGSLLRIHDFLTTWGFINEQAINDSAPTPPGYHAETGTSTGRNKTDVVWSATARDELMEAVVDESKKRRKVDGDSSFVPIDWAGIATRVGNGASASDCEKVFLALPLEAAVKTQEERSITPDVTSGDQKHESAEDKIDLGEKVLQGIVAEAPPEVVKAATDAALAATEHVGEAQKAGLLAVVASQAATRAQNEEATVGRLLAELQEQRLQKLENRLALLDDVEDILEAERVALELERRDLYTARCRHWFGGAS